MSRAHRTNNGREFNKKGLTVNVKQSNLSSEGAYEAESIKFMDNAIRNLKKTMQREGVIRDMCRKDFYESKGQIRKRKREIAIRKHQKESKNRDF